MATPKTPEETWQPPRHMWSLIRAAHFIKVNSTPEIWQEFLRAFSVVEHFEILNSARGRPAELLEWKQGRSSLTWELGVCFDRASEMWRDIEKWLKQQEEAERGRATDTNAGNAPINGA